MIRVSSERIASPDFSEEELMASLASEGVRICANPGCANPARPRTGTRGKHPKFCDEHSAPSTRERRPPSLTINMGGRKAGKKSDADKVADMALKGAQMFAAGLMMIGQSSPMLVADAADIGKSAPAWSAAVGNLAEYEPWIAKLATTADVSGRMTAWIGFAFATGGMSLPILLRHGALPTSIATMLDSVMTLAASQPIPVDADPVNPTPEAVPASMAEGESWSPAA